MKSCVRRQQNHLDQNHLNPVPIPLEIANSSDQAIATRPLCSFAEMQSFWCLFVVPWDPSPRYSHKIACACQPICPRRSPILLPPFYPAPDQPPLPGFQPGLHRHRPSWRRDQALSSRPRSNPLIRIQAEPLHPEWHLGSLP